MRRLSVSRAELIFNKPLHIEWGKLYMEGDNEPMLDIRVLLAFYPKKKLIRITKDAKVKFGRKSITIEADFGSCLYCVDIPRSCVTVAKMVSVEVEPAIGVICFQK